jgi:FkbM family methyltransferase
MRHVDVVRAIAARATQSNMHRRSPLKHAGRMISLLSAAAMKVLPNQLEVEAYVRQCRVKVRVPENLNVYLLGIHEPLETEVIESLVQPGTELVDVGAHIGYYTVIMSLLARSIGHVYAFEPDPDCYRLLRFNSTKAGIANVSTFNVAVGDSDGYALPARRQVYRKAYPISANREGASIGMEVQSGDLIQMVTLDSSLPHGAKIGLIKLDIEGYEPAVLRGMLGVLGRSQDCIIITEFWPWGLRSAGFDPAGYLRSLTNLGYHFFDINEQKGRVSPTSTNELLGTYGLRGYTNLLCRKAARSPNAEPTVVV